jgi:hypothetical protein
VLQLEPQLPQSLLPQPDKFDHHCKDHSDAASNQEEHLNLVAKKDLVDMNPSLQGS